MSSTLVGKMLIDQSVGIVPLRTLRQVVEQELLLFGFIGLQVSSLNWSMAPRPIKKVNSFF